MEKEGERGNIQGGGRKHVEMCFLGFFYLLIIKLEKAKKNSRKKYGKMLKLHYSVFLAVINKCVRSSA